MWVRGVLGLTSCLVGVIWTAQGTDLLHGSFMSGSGLYTGLGVGLLVIGLSLLAWAWQIRNRRTR
ncbi:MAG: hypothetical protein ACHQFZ_05300 [Acidimicrobiales bacterium]